MSSIRLTPMYTQKNELVFPAEQAYVELPLPVGRKELATTWWKGCPDKCRAHLPQSKGVCRRNCAALRRKVSTLSKRMIESTECNGGGKTELFRVHSTCRYPELIHLRRIVKQATCEPTMFDLRIGDDAEYPWMRFRIELVASKVIVSTPRAVQPKVAARVTDDSQSQKRRRTDNESVDSNSSQRELFPDERNATPNCRKQCRSCEASSGPAESTSDKSPSRRHVHLDRLTLLNSSEGDNVNSGLSSKSAPLCVDDGYRFSTQLRLPVGTTSAEQSLTVAQGPAKDATACKIPPLVERKGQRIERRLSLGGTGGNEMPLRAHDLATPLANATVEELRQTNQVGLVVSANTRLLTVGMEQRNMPTMNVEPTDVATGEVNASSGAASHHEEIPPLSFLSLPECPTQGMDSGDEMYEATQVQKSRLGNDRPIERRAGNLTINDWKELQATIPRGPETSFRSALVDLIVAKHGASTDPTALWLPPFMDAETIVK